MEKIASYKMYQLLEVLICKYDFKQVIIQEFKELQSKEFWVYNPDNVYYQLVRITTNSAEAFVYDESRVDSYIKYFNNIYKEEVSFLDIHISNEVYNKEDEKYKFINIEENYFGGTDIRFAFPLLLDRITAVNSEPDEIARIFSNITNHVKSTYIKQKKQKEKKAPNFATYTVMAICILIYLISFVMKMKFDSTAVMIFLGADYRPFTQGLYQFYRIITSAFLHQNILHLLFNMISLYNIGSYIEIRLGRKQFISALFVSIIFGTLCQNIMSDTNVLLGISGGIYGLLTIYLLDVYESRTFLVKELTYNIFLNILIAVNYPIAIFAHLGGAIGGLCMYLIFKNDNKKAKALSIIFVAVIMIALFAKYLQNTSYSLYGGTDQEVLNIYKTLGLNNYANKLLSRLLKLYGR